ncbi:MAG: CpsD/CapB family tyrosine-protein kinase [Rhodobacteraceae bacterium]|nr:CpsD/CapB family tyrosine-protein kinase [Paracoccaceae bacterium]
MSRAGDKQEIEGIRYKRFRRGGSRSKAKRADTVFPGEKPFVVPTIVSTPGLGLDDPVLQPGSVVLPTVEMGCWTALRQVTIGGRQAFAGNIPLVSFNRTDPASRAFDQLRTLLLQILRSNGWNRVAISAPTQGCGSTFTAVNLGLSFARIPGSRTVLMDLNLRTPGIAKALGIQSRGDARGYLSGQIDTSQYLVRVKDTLALGLAGSPDQDAAELLHDPRTGVALSSMSDDLRPDVTLFDLPPILAFDDLAAFLPQVDGVLLVADGTKTTAAHIKACQRILDGQTKVLGVTLNQARSAEQ